MFAETSCSEKETMDRLCLQKYSEIIHSKRYLKSAAKCRDNEWTVLAGVVICRAADPAGKVIVLATGVKCVPECKLWEYPEAFDDCLHDMHAEVLARRSAIKYLVHHLTGGSMSIEELKSEAVSFHLYTSHVPCGEASMDSLIEEKSVGSESSISCFKGSLDIEVDGLLRGRTDFSQRNRLRTKPGRLDSPPSLSLSCTDKITRWSVLGWQGARLFQLLNRALYFKSISVGTGYNKPALESSINQRTIDFSDRCHVEFIESETDFEYSKSQSRQQPSPVGFSWIADMDSAEILTCTGRKFGAVPDKRTGMYSKKVCSRICRAALKQDFDLLDLKFSRNNTFEDGNGEYNTNKNNFKQHYLFSEWGKKRMTTSIT